MEKFENFTKIIPNGQNSSTSPLLEIKKTPSDIFSFFINNLTDQSIDSSFIHNFLGQPTIPLLGKYAKDSYEMSSVLSLVVTEYNLTNEKENSNKLNNIEIDSEIINFLSELKNSDIENNTKSDTFQLGNIVKSPIKFYWVAINNNLSITGQNGSNNNKQNNFNVSKNSEIFNIVPHTFLFKNLDFSKSKRLVKNYPISIYITENISKSCGLDPYNDYSHKKNFHTNINFNKLRIEYSSTHLIKESLGFSPNNLKFLLFKDYQISHFYLVIVENNEYHVFYYWILNSEYKEYNSLINSIFNKSDNLSNLLSNLHEILGEHPCMRNLKYILKI